MVLLSRAAAAQPLLSKPSPQPAFEVASVRPTAPPSLEERATIGIKGGPGTGDPGRITCRFVGIVQLLMRAYDVTSWQIQGLPDWANDAGYDIVAKVPPGTTPRQADLMLQNLLIERLGLVTHIETRPGEIYELTVAKGGSKLKEPADPSAEPSLKSVQAAVGRVLVFTNEPVSSLFPTIEAWHHLVVDKTGMTGKYDFSMPLLFPPRAAPASATFEDSSSDAALASVLERYLGLKLERKKALVDTLVIDHLEKAPTPN